MGWITIIQLVISLTEGVLGGLTKSNAPQEILDALSVALGKLQEVHGTLVTKSQVDGITLDYKW
jgi:hypothetical protein